MPTQTTPSTMGFAPPHASLSDEVREVLDALMRGETDTQLQPEWAPHMAKGLEQVEAFLQMHHSDMASFESLAARDSASWAEHVKHAEDEADFNARMRPVQESLEVQLKLHDLKVGRPGRPDDSVYQKSEYARKRMPRGNCVAEWTSPETQQTYWFPVVRAYRKFTGHEDGGETKGKLETEVLSKFFTKSLNDARTVITTTKENGEAAHLAVLKRADGQYLYAVGSKNTHMIVTSADDIEAACEAVTRGSNGGNPYVAAAVLGKAVLNMLDQLTPANRQFLCEFLWQTRLTASFEVLCPDHQHVQLLDYLTENTPVFYGFSFAAMEPPAGADICINPVLPYVLMRHLGVRTVQFRVLDYTPDTVAAALHDIKHTHQHEGAVNLLLDENACVIGLEKYKTVWYVCLRAIREKAKRCVNTIMSKKENQRKTLEIALDETKKQMRKRFKSIKVFLDLTPEICDAYCTLGENFVEYLTLTRLATADAKEKEELRKSVGDMFPIVWKEVLEATNTDDRIGAMRDTVQ
ncbi:TPA: hypothetical protein N0F65_002153 [Lagenidium giganteum]|uniref:DUF7920 domain-containing protein n=1 Tax=Lagenidium giganteum TaxID=4803 RepID=A0AAV2YQ64_9STRA|nr:TPA: hypothetical protein N0F65_002153 [Lagenidium giganteum]